MNATNHLPILPVYRPTAPQMIYSSAEPHGLTTLLAKSGNDFCFLSTGWTGTPIVAAKPAVHLRVIEADCGFALEISIGGWRHRQPMASAAEAIAALCRQLDAGLQAPTAPLGVGWIGYIGYDLQRRIEGTGPHRSNEPLAHMCLYQHFYIYHADGKWLLVEIGEPASASLTEVAELSDVGEMSEARGLDDTAATGGMVETAGMMEMIDTLRAAEVTVPCEAGVLRDARAPTQPPFISAVRRALEYIGAGDIYQINLCGVWAGRSDNPYELWRSMYEKSPGRYSAFIQSGDWAVCSISPELFLSRRGASLITQPIKGTRIRNRADAAADDKARGELLLSGKEESELAMIVDLLRNDLGRACDIGSVRLSAARQVESLPHLWQTYATIEGKTNASWGTILNCMLPGGSITGVPKIRAMEIIDELEGTARGIYCGNIGWMRADAGDLNIAIRTATWHAGHATYRAGAGIVAESNPVDEYCEICAKAWPFTSTFSGLATEAAL